MLALKGKKGYLLFPLLILLIGLLVPAVSMSSSRADEPAGWYEQDSGTTAVLAAVAAADTSTAWVVGAEGTILKTTDGGNSWLPQESGTTLHLADICAVDGNIAWVLGVDGGTGDAFIVLRTIDGGEDWETIAEGTGFKLVAIEAVSAEVAWVGGFNGVISRTIDGGDHWSIQNTGTTTIIRDIAALDADNAWAVGGFPDQYSSHGGVILKTTDGGWNWTAQTDPAYWDRAAWVAVEAFDVNNVCVLGYYDYDGGALPIEDFGIFQKSNDGGASWIPGSYRYGFNTGMAISAADASTAWIVGRMDSFFNRNISKSTNRCTTWACQELSDPQVDLYDVSAASSEVAWALGTDGTIVHTVDGGFTQPPPHIDAISPTYCGSESVVDVQVTISGSNFGNIQPMIPAVAFGEWPILGAATWSDTEITFSVSPAMLYQSPPGPYEVTVTGEGGTSNEMIFALVDMPTPIISVITPLTAGVGDEIIISGSDFGEADVSSQVLFDDTYAGYESWSDTSVVCRVPEGIPVSSTIRVATGGGFSNPVSFTLKPHIDAISPTEGTAGTEVTITGSALDSYIGIHRGAVFIDGVELGKDSNAYISIAESQIIFRMPALPAGDKTITVANPGNPGNTSNEVTFTVLPIPAVSAVEPLFTTIGSEVTISGYNFGAEQGGSYVSFGDVQVTDYLSWSDTSIVCRVPAGASSSWGPVTVTTPEGTSYSDGDEIFIEARLRGRVTDAMSGEPIEGIYVCLFYYNQNPTQIVYYDQTDSNGEYLLEGVDPVEYRIGFTDLTGAYQFEFYDEQLEFDLAQPVDLYPSPDMVIDEDMIPILSVASVSPASGVQNTVVSATITGNRFEPGVTARLENAGAGVSITATDIVFVSASQITCSFNLSGAPLGNYDVVVTNPDGSEARLVNGFRVTDMCGQGSGTAVLMLGLAMGLLSLAGSTRLRNRKRRS